MREGTRVKLRHDVDRYPHFVAPAGSTGTVTEVYEDLICVQMDEPLAGAEEWDNEVQWFDEPHERIHEDVEILGEGDLEVAPAGTPRQGGPTDLEVDPNAPSEDLIGALGAGLSPVDVIRRKGALLEAGTLPLAVSDLVAEIAEEACQAAFSLIADRLEALGYPVSGDFTPDEVEVLDHHFQGYVLAMSLNNDRIASMQEDN